MSLYNSKSELDIAARGRVWVITGTSSGLGRSLVEVALARGDCVIATARNVGSIREFTANPETAARVHVMRLDVTAPFSELRKMAAEAVKKWGRVDVLVNNAGAGKLGISEEVGVEGYQIQFATNFFGPLNIANAFLPYMRARREGMIVFVGSRSSWRANVPMLGTYAASKAALSAAAEALSVEVAPLNIKILNVLPGGLRTQSWAKMTLLPTVPGALLPPLGLSKPNGTERIQSDSAPSATSSPILDPDAITNAGESTEQHIADYAELRSRQVEWMLASAPDGDAEKCAHAIVDVVTDNIGPNDEKGGKGRGWPELGMLVLGADAEANIRDKCHAVLRNLDEWKDVVTGIAMDR